MEGLLSQHCLYFGEAQVDSFVAEVFINGGGIVNWAREGSAAHVLVSLGGNRIVALAEGFGCSPLSRVEICERQFFLVAKAAPSVVAFEIF